MHRILILFVALSSGLLRAGEEAAATTVDFRYSLPWWQCSICLPDDPEKALVGKEGQFFFDFGKGGPRNFAVSILPGIEEETKWLRQEMVSAKAPVVKTWRDANGVEMLSEAFLSVPGTPAEPNVTPSSLRRVSLSDGKNVERSWAKPRIPCDPSFTDIALGENGTPIVYEARVPGGSAAKVVFGFCEGWWDKPGQRLLKLSAEGAAPREIDPAKDFGRNTPGLYVLDARDTDNDGIIRIQVDAQLGAPDRNVILNALWLFAGEVPPHERIIRGEENTKALAYAACGTEALPPHRYIALLHLTNAGTQAQTRRPLVRIEGVLPVEFRKETGTVMIGGTTHLLASTPIESCEKQGKEWIVRLAPQEIPAGARREVALTVLRNEPNAGKALDAAGASRERDRAIHWWEKEADLPWDAIQVPDPAIQAMLHSCVRNIWQAREIKKGQPAFHVGPTCYRGLWIVDGAFLLESAALTGRAAEARAGIQYMLSFQKPDGSFDVLGHYWKENGIVLWACCRHAVLTQDKAWLESVWPKLEKTVAAIKQLRERSRKEGSPLDDDLMPPGFPDGGLGGTPSEYTNVYWNLAGLKTAIAAAHWLGKSEQAAQWQAEYDDFLATFRKAAERDMAADPHGNRYLPIIMGPDGKKQLPQRAQWGFLHAVYPGQVFAKDDPLVQGNMAMLRATKQQGLVFGTGWDADGIWTYAASFYGHAVLWQGEGAEAAQVLYDYANHAAPVRVWREEQRPVGKGTHEVGDMPHNWASAEFIRLATHLIQIDRGDELHLFEGLPRAWVKPGMTTQLKGVPTPFGPLTMELTVDAKGKKAQLTVEPLDQTCCKRVVVHEGPWCGREKEKTVELKPGKRMEKTFELR